MIYYLIKFLKSKIGNRTKTMKRFTQRNNLYFIRNGGPGPVTSLIKIGYSKDPSNRLKQLQVGNPVRLELRTTIGVSNGYQAENNAHQYFSDKRVNGEWFELTEKSINDYIFNFPNE